MDFSLFLGFYELLRGEGKREERRMLKVAKRDGMR
jgi:hypothetical protein